MLVRVDSIALLVGGVGVANTMVITVLERRREIGLRRSLGATRAHIRTQFLVEAVMPSNYGGAVGTLLGMAITFIVAHLNEWAFTIPPIVIAGGIAVTIAVGAVAGMLPAIEQPAPPRLPLSQAKSWTSAEHHTIVMPYAKNAPIEPPPRIGSAYSDDAPPKSTNRI